MKMMKRCGELWRYRESYGDLRRAKESYRDIWRATEIYGELWRATESSMVSYRELWRATEIYGELQTAKKRLTALNPGLAGYAGEKSSEQASTITVIGYL